MNVIIIDDDAEDTEMFSIALSEIAPHVTCHSVNNPKKALEEIKEKKLQPEVIFLDANMFMIDGVECLKELRKLPWLRDTTIYMFSGYIQENKVEEMKSLGANEYLIKPHTFDGLRALLQSIFSVKDKS